jgi:uncharacterized membrane-anchored protein
MSRAHIFVSLFVITALVQLAAPLSIIWQHEQALRLGRAYKFRTAPVDPYDALRGRYVALQFDQTTVPLPDTALALVPDQRVYVLLEESADGFAHFTTVLLTPPAAGDYLGVEVAWVDSARQVVALRLPFERFYLEEATAPAAEQVYREHSRRGQQDAYALVRVRHGRGVLANLYIGDTPIADFVRTSRQGS